MLALSLKKWGKKPLIKEWGPDPASFTVISNTYSQK